MFVRFLVSPDRSHFFRVVHNYVDFLAVCPLILRAAVGFKEINLDANHSTDSNVNDLIASTLICIVPILRLMKLLRRFQKFLLLLHAFKDAAEALPVLLFTLTGIALTFS